MSTLTGGNKFHFAHSLLTYANNCNRFFYAWEHTVHHCATFINNQGRLYTLTFQPVNHCRCTDTSHLFITAERQINIIFRHKTVGQQIFHCFHNANHGNFGIQSATTPENTINNFASKRRMLPAVFLNRYHVIMAHKYGRLFITFAFDFKQHCSVAQFPVFTVGSNLWIKFFQFLSVGRKNFLVCFVKISIGNSFVLHQSGQVFSGSFAVYLHRPCPSWAVVFCPEFTGPENKNSNKYNQ